MGREGKLNVRRKRKIWGERRKMRGEWYKKFKYGENVGRGVKWRERLKCGERSRPIGIATCQIFFVTVNTYRFS